MRCISVLSVLLFITCYSVQARQINAFYIGHSLSDQIPDMVMSFANDHPDARFAFTYQSIPGAPLRWQWDHGATYIANPPYYAGYNDSRYGLPTGSFDVLVLTESVPRYDAIINESYAYSDSFYVYATQFNPDVRIFLYEDWHCLDSGTPTGCDYDIDSADWRQRLTDDLPMWESVVDHLNAKYSPVSPVCMIPGGQGLANLYDAIHAGSVPGLTSIADLFSDRIHLNDIGKYFIATIHFAVIFARSPIGLTSSTQHWWGGQFERPSRELATRLQEIAWSTVLTYPQSCLAQTNSDENERPESFDLLQNYPNPFRSSTKITFNVATAGHIELSIYNALGYRVFSVIDQFLPAGTHTFEVEGFGWPSGLYFYELRSSDMAQTKQMILLK